MEANSQQTHSNCRSNCKCLFASTLIIIGIALFVLTLISFVRAPLNPAVFSEKLPEFYGNRTVSKAELNDFLSANAAPLANPQETMRQLNKLVSGYFVHSTEEEAPISISDNWIMWLIGHIDPRFMLSQDASTLIRKGGGQCEQAAVLFTSLAQKMGVEAHLVWFGGHVASEVTIPEKGYQVVDPDMGIYWGVDYDFFGRELPCAEIAKGLIATGYSDRIAEKISQAYCTPEGNKRSDFPYQMDTYLVEKTSLILLWLLPLILLGSGIWLLRSKKQ